MNVCLVVCVSARFLVEEHSLEATDGVVRAAAHCFQDVGGQAAVGQVLTAKHLVAGRFVMVFLVEV